MNFRELINQLEAIDQPILSETVTLDSIMAAVGKEPDEQKRADLLQKMAEKENLPGLYDPVSGYFVSVFQDREPMTNQLKTRISSTASSEVTNQLADLGLVPSKANTRSLGGLVGVGALSNSTEKNDAMDQEVKNRFKNKQPTAGGTAAADQAARVLSADEATKMTQLEGLVDQYLALKATSKKVAEPGKDSTKTRKDKASTDSETGDSTTDSGKSTTGEKALATGVGGVAGYKLMNNPKPQAGPKVNGKFKLRPTLGGIAGGLIGGTIGNQVANENIAKSLVESFGYQKKPSIEEIVESLGLRKDYPYGYQFLKEASTTTSNKDELEIGDDDEEDEIIDPVETRKNVFGAGGSGSKAIQGIVKTLSGNNKKPVSKDPQSKFDMAFHNKYWNNWTEDSLSWDDTIIPGFDWMDGEPLYTFKELGLDLGIAAGFVMVGTIMAPFTAGASIPVAAAAGVTAGVTRAAGSILIKLLIKIAIAIIKAVKLYGKPFWEFAQGNLVKTIKAVGQIAKTYLEAFYNGIAKNFAARPLLITAFWTMGFVGLLKAWEKYSGEYLADYIKKPIDQGFGWLADKTRQAFDGARKITGLEEGSA